MDMPLESLLALVERLRERIDAHGSDLRGSEALTRYALIDPMLRELGWDTADPSMVTPEYRSGEGRADYALMRGGKPVMMVEAKSLDDTLQGAVSQGITYCLKEGTSHFLVTNGKLWELYETHKPVPVEEKRVVSFDLKGQSAAEVCLAALALWRQGVQAGYVAPGQPPVDGPSEAETQPTPIPPQTATVSQTVVNEPEPGWVALSEFDPSTARPAMMRFPDGADAPISTWYEILTLSANWLWENGHLSIEQCPISMGPNSRRCLVSATPEHPNGKSFYSPVKIGPLYVETNVSSRSALKHANLLIDRLHLDPAQFKLRSQ